MHVSPCQRVSSLQRERRKVSRSSAQRRQRSIVPFVLAVISISLVVWLLEQWLFWQEDAGIIEICALGAFMGAAVMGLSRRRARKPRCNKGTVRDDSRNIAVSVHSSESLLGKSQRPRWPVVPRCASSERSRRAIASSDGCCNLEARAAHFEGILEACQIRDLAVAEARLVEMLRRFSSSSVVVAIDCVCDSLRAKSDGASTVVLGQQHIQQLVLACIDAGGSCRASAWLAIMHESGLHPLAKTVVVVLQALIQERNSTLAEQLLERLHEVGVQLDLGCYQMVFEQCIQPGDIAGVERWLNLLRLRGPTCHTQGYVAVLRARAHTGTASEAQFWMSHGFENSVLQTSQLYNAAIHACARAGDLKCAEQWLNCMEGGGTIVTRSSGSKVTFRVDPDVFSYSAIMDACAQQGETSQAEAWFERMINAGISPDAASFNTVIKAHARVGDMSGAERWLLRARRETVRLDAFSFNAVIAAAARAADPKMAEQWLRQMLEDGAVPDVVSYNSVINAWAKRGNAVGAERMVALMCRNDVEPDVVTLGVAVHACARAGDLYRAEAIFQLIIARGQTQPDAISYNALINAAVKAGDTARAEHWLSGMLEDGVTPSVVSYTTVLHAHARAGNVEAAELGLERMLERGVEANVVSFSALIHACVKAGDVSRAEKWFEQMRQGGIQANAVSYSVMLNVCAKAADYNRAERWLKAMLGDGVEPNVVCYNNVIDACAKAGRADRAEAWLRHLIQSASSSDSEGGSTHGLAPTRQSYTTAAQAYATHGAWGDVERLFSEMERAGMSQDEFSLTVLLSAYSRARPRKRERAEATFKQYTAQGLPLTKPPLRVLRSIVGAQRFERLLAEQGVHEFSEGLS